MHKPSKTESLFLLDKTVPQAPVKQFIKFGYSALSRFFAILILLLFLSTVALAQLRTASVSGNWNNIATWGGASVPTSANDVVINNNINVTIDIASAECLSLSINGGANASYVTVGANSLAVTNAITINAPTAAVAKYIIVGNGSLSCASVTMEASTNNAWDSYISIIGTGSVNVSGNITMNGSNLRNFIHFSGTGSLNIGGAFGGTTGGGITSNIAGAATAPTSGMVNFNGAGNQTIPAFSGYWHLTISNSGTKTLAAATTINRNLYITGSTTLDCRQYNITGNATGTFVMDAGTGLIIGDPATATANAFPSTFTAGNISFSTTSIVTYSADANQTISGVPTYGNLTISAGNGANRTRTLGAATLISGNLSITGGGTFTTSLLPAANNITANGTTTINSNGIFNDATNGGANRFDGLVSVATGGQFVNSVTSPTEFRGSITNNGTFTKSGTGTTTFSTNTQTIGGLNVLTFSGGDIVIAEPASLNVSTTISFSGTNFTNNSNTTPAFNATAGTFTFALAGVQNIGGAGIGSILFYNLTAGGTGVKTTGLPFSVSNNLIVPTGATLTLGNGTAGSFPVGGTAALNGTGTLNLGTVSNTINIAGSLTVDGTLNYGTLVAKSMSVGGDLINVTGAITMAADGLAHQMNLGGSNNAISTFTTTGSGISVNYNGAIDQQVFASANYRTLIISGGGTKTIQGAVIVNNTLDLQNGNIASAANALTLVNAAVVTNSISGIFDNTHMIVTDGTGSFIKQSATSAGFIMVYPVGTGTYYSPMEITSLTATAPVAIQLRAVAGRAPNTNPTDLNKHWVIVSNLGTISANVSFLYDDPGEVLGEQTKYAPRFSAAYPATVWSTPAGASPDGANPISSVGTTQLAGAWTARENATTLYSYQNGNWNVATTWTTDPSGTLSQGAAVPTALDRVVILNGRSITVTNNSNTVYSLNVNEGGVLDLAGTSLHNFGNIGGQGLIRLSIASMPGGTYDNFVAAGGGTVEYYNSVGFTISQLTYNNVILNLNTPALIATLTGNMVVNGNLTITQGVFQINDATATIRNLSVAGDVNVTTTGSITLGAGNANHRFSIGGDFTNDGTVDFYELDAADYTGTNYAGTAHADVVFNNSSADQNLLCNGSSQFYRIEIDKGVDQTYVLNIDASASGNFQLYGRNNQVAVTDTPPIDNQNALGLMAGTVRLGNNIILPRLATAGSYIIDQDAQLWLDGSNVTFLTAASNNAFVIYGKARFSNSCTFDASFGNYGVLTREASEIEIESGTITFHNLRPSVLGGATHRGTFKMYDGSLTIISWDNSGLANQHGSFSIPFPDNVFIMSGGTIDIQNPQNAGGSGQNFSLLIGINTQNASVTGGTIRINTTPRNAYLNSTIPLPNLEIYGNANAAFVRNYAGGGTPAAPALTPQPLVVIGNLSIQNTSVLNTSATGGTPAVANIFIGANFNIPIGTTYTPGLNTTTFNASGPQTFDASGTITGNLNNVTLANTSDVTLSGNNITILSTGTLSIGDGCTLRDNGRTIFVQGNISNSGMHFKPVSGAGSIQLTGATAQIISGDGTGIFNNLTLNKTGGTVTTTADLIISGELRLANAAARLNIGSNNLAFTVDGDVYDNLSGTGKVFSSTKMILSNGYPSDGGLSKTYSGTSAFVFPVGIYINPTYYYNPASVQFSSALASYGTVTTRPVIGRHPLAQGANNALTCFWKTTSSGFPAIPAGTVRHLYYYDYSGTNYFVAGSEAVYVPGFFDNSGWTFINDPILIDKGNNIISYNVANAADGEFTAGDPTTAFVSVPVRYSSGVSTDWNTNTTWSATGVGVTTDPSSPPAANTLVVIGDATHNHTVVINQNGKNAGSLNIASGSTLDLQNYNNHNFAGIPDKGVSGGGTLRIASTNYFPRGDFGGFIGENGGTVEYYTIAAVGNITLPVTSDVTLIPLTTYKNLKLSNSSTYNITLPNLTTAPNTLIIYGNLIISGGGTGTARLNTIATQTVVVNGNLNVNSGIFEFRTPAQTLRVLGDVTIANGATFQTQNVAGATHTLELWGNLTANGTFDVNQGTNYANTYFKGTSNTSISGASATIDFYRLYVDKGTNTSPVLSLTTPITTGFSSPFLDLSNGTFRVNNSSLTVTLTNATTDFDIPSTACLSVAAGTCRVAYNSGAGAGSNDLLLSGKLEVLGGNMIIGNTANNTANDIIYAAGGQPQIDVQGGLLTVAGQVCRSSTITSGSLNYGQSGSGSAIIYGNNSLAIRAKFEILNRGSSFITSGTGILTILNGGGTSFGDFYLSPDSSSVLGGTVQIGDNTSAADQTFTLFASAPLYNLSVGTSLVSQNLELSVYPLNINNDLTIYGGSTFLANGFNVNIAHNLINNNSSATTGLLAGGYQPGVSSQITTFNGIGAQSITGNGTNITNFANLVISSSGTVSLSANTTLRVNSDLSLSSGILSGGSNNIYVIGDVYNIISHTSSTPVGGINLVGSQLQKISGSGTFGNLVINNSNGVNMLDNTTINGRLTITNGNLYLDDYLLTLGTTSSVAGTFNATHMIMLNGALSDQGVKKMFPANASPAFTLPIGVAGKYTPAIYTIFTTDAPGTITVRPINGKHPALSDASGNELSFYWSVDSSGFASNLSLSHQYQYVQADINLPEASNVIGKYNYRSYTWSNLGNVAPYTINTVSNRLIFNPVSYISGDFTAGVNTNFAAVTPLYSRNSRPNNNWSDPQSWTTSPDGSDCVGGSCTAGHSTSSPAGNPCIILPGNTILLDVNSANAVSVEINGTLDCGTTTYHSLGHVFGTGYLKITSTPSGVFVFPGGTFDEFFATTGTTLEFAGDNTASLPLKPGNVYKPFQNVIFSGIGKKNISAENLKVLSNLTISSGTVLSNSLYNKDIYCLGNWVDNNTSASGGFVPGTGMVHFQGSGPQNISIADATTTEQFYNLKINNSTGLTIAGSGKVLVSKNLYLSLGNISTSATNLLTLSNTSISAVIGGGASSFVNGPLRKNINNGQSFTFPIGGGARYGQFILRNTSVVSSPQYWTATYINNNPNPTYPTGPTNLTAPVSDISNNEYWEVIRPSGASANITLRWDANSYSGVTGDASLRTKLRVVEYDLGATSWTQRGASVSGNATSGTVSTTTPVTNDSFIFTLGLIGVTAGIITPPTTYSICDNGQTASIPVSLTGTSPWSLNYRTVGNSITKNFSQSGITSSPYTIQLAATDLGGYGALPYTLSLISVSDASTSGTCNSTTVDVSVLQTYTPSITGSSSAGSGETRSYSTPSHPGSLYSWTWVGSSGGSIASPSTASTNITFNAGVGVFQLQLQETSSSGCFATSVLPITVSSLPTPDITPKTANICIGSTVDYSTTYNTGNEYRWTVTNGNCTGCDVFQSNSPQTISVLWNSAGSSTVSVEERIIATPAITATATQNYEVSPMPLTKSVAPDLLTICEGGSANIIVTNSQSGVSYQLRDDNGDVVIGLAKPGTDLDLSIPTGSLTPSGVYTFNVLAFNNGCQLEIPSGLLPSITVNPLPSVTITGLLTGSPACDQDLVQVNIIFVGTQPFSFTMKDGQGNTWTESGINSPSGASYVYNIPTAYSVWLPPTTSTTYIYEITLLSDDTSCSASSIAGSATVVVYKIPDTGTEYHIPNNFGL